MEKMLVCKMSGYMFLHQRTSACDNECAVAGLEYSVTFMLTKVTRDSWLAFQDSMKLDATPYRSHCSTRLATTSCTVCVCVRSRNCISEHLAVKRFAVQGTRGFLETAGSENELRCRTRNPTETQARLWQAVISFYPLLKLNHFIPYQLKPFSFTKE